MISLVGQMGLNCSQDSTTAMAKSISQYPMSPTEDPRLPTSLTEDVPSSKNEVKFLFEDLKEMTQQAKSKPIDFKDDPVPRAFPFVHKSVTTYGIEMRTIEVPMFKPSWVMLIMERYNIGILQLDCNILRRDVRVESMRKKKKVMNSLNDLASVEGVLYGHFDSSLCHLNFSGLQ
ncbi:unnamed protein product [Lactuca saligna]|uniref:Uncharacterized protein n=1 Tax=Lactuca saligna TaxID=75948 RepID=A0AA36E3A5_LACSI|nr:unnamed protein product [Lactuca saligna]